MTMVLNLRSASRTKTRSIRSAADIIRSGGIVVFPTETVYGIGASAFNEDACRKIYRIKGRAPDNPLIVHVSSMKMAKSVGDIPARYSRILSHEWPGPLTVVVKAKESVPKTVTGGLRTVAMRMPDNSIALELIKRSGVPIAAPSANISKRPSSTDATNAKRYFMGKVDAIIDSGSTEIGIESTVLRLSDLSILRPGSYTPEHVREAFGRWPKMAFASKGVSRPPSPGMKYRHYSPEKPIYLFIGDIGRLPSIIKRSGSSGKFTFIGSKESCAAMKSCSAGVLDLGNRSRPHEIAHNLFSALIALDSKKSKFGIIESFDESGIGIAIMNRIRKACSNKYFSDEKGIWNIVKV